MLPLNMKTCKRYLVEKNLSSFRKTGKYYKSYCNDCDNKISNIWKKNHKETVRAYKARYKFKIGQKDYELIKNRSEHCEICGKKEMIGGRKLTIDHDHNTGKVRGLLCMRCNLGMGSFFDDPLLLEKAAHYLRNTK